jgi:mannose-6-phosphate isomerase-like protein (cupin superfamily)
MRFLEVSKYLMINIDPSSSIPRIPELVPMHHHAPLLPLVELSLADAIARIEKAPDLSSQTKTQWAVALGVTTAAAAPLFSLVTPARAAAPAYGPTDGKEVSPGIREVEVGKVPSEMAAYKEVQVIDVVFQPGAADPKEAVMDMDMVCYILAGEFRIKKAGKEFTVKEGDFYTCGKGKTDQAFNTGNVVGIHRIAILVPA